METFGTFFKKMRIQKEKTLRQFCEENDFDPGNISKIERDILSAPTSEEKLNSYAKALGIKKGSDDYVEFLDLASASRKTMPIKNIMDQDLLNRLPVLFRTLDKKDITAEKLDRIIEIVKKEMDK